jgi:hypothetical protein
MPEHPAVHRDVPVTPIALNGACVPPVYRVNEVDRVVKRTKSEDRARMRRMRRWIGSYGRKVVKRLLNEKIQYNADRERLYGEVLGIL